MSKAAISIDHLHKTFRTGLRLKRFVALDELSLEVREGEILGYLGPNGAGKTTTFKLLLGLMKPDRGGFSFFGGAENGDFRDQTGYLPENPYFYSYLTARESLHFYGRLYGMTSAARQRRTEELLDQVGLAHARDRQLRKFSRGMLQRLGIAQALINDPRLLILDEPMSGLDPMGRKQMRDIIASCRDQGKTVIFSSHILADVEMLCDRAAILLNGRLQEVVGVSEILNRKIDYWEIVCEGLSDPDKAELARSHALSTSGAQTLIKVDAEPVALALVERIRQTGGRLISFGPHRESLEDIFVQRAAAGRVN